ncbi:uncharacterized protein GIQ15_02797 [Arthroderma uncinatum]|uniref:uncharacterized protein n=1 Tax=Arthroderma uncinatum TaxID=74035 RepID=UPI00144A7E4C|nr:uncharacterized protein GIQ15_02797 [Arthroderma uncinatum]KAF3483473.1 hypothetical protein GIQ15_02797 [Arthroderma uncinatum]
MAHTSLPWRRREASRARVSTHHQDPVSLQVDAREASQGTKPLPYGTLLRKIEDGKLFKSSAEPRITGCNYLASYSWSDKPSPTVLISGKPAAWNPPTTARQIKPDTGEYFRDLNAARYAAHPMQPAVQAVLHQNPVLSASDVDIFTCASVLGNLSRFVRGTFEDSITGPDMEEHNFPSYLNEDESDLDYTACDAEGCGYCGHYKY